MSGCRGQATDVATGIEFDFGPGANSDVTIDVGVADIHNIAITGDVSFVAEICSAVWAQGRVITVGAAAIAGEIDRLLTHQSFEEGGRFGGFYSNGPGDQLNGRCGQACRGDKGVLSPADGDGRWQAAGT